MDRMKTGFLSGGGAAGALMRSYPWEQSPLGPVEAWPDSLRTVVALMLNSQFPMFLLWGEQRVCLYNDGYIAILGQRHPRAMARPMQAVWPEIWDEIRPLIDDAYAGRPSYFENLPLLVERNGFSEQACFTFSYSPLRGTQGSIRGMFCTCTETTVQVRAETALRDNEARWRSLFENMQEGFLVAEAVRDAQRRIVDVRLIEVNPAFEIQCGLAASSAPGRRLRDLVPATPDALIDAYAQVIESGQPRHFEMDLRAVDGRWYEVRARPLGQPDRLAVLFLDISVRRRIEVALRRSEAQFRGLAQAMPDQAWTARADGSLDWFNDRVYDYAGRAAGDLDGVRHDRIVHPDDIGAAAAVWMRAVTTGCPFQAEFRLRRKDGIYRWHIARATPILAEDGGVERWIGTNTDIEERKRAADLLEIAIAERSAELEKAHEALRQAQKMEVVGQLTGGIAHDFNNLLTGVIGGIEMMQTRLAQGRRAEAERGAELAMQSAQRAAALTHRLLAFSRRQPLEPRAVDVNALIDSMAEMIRRSIGPAIRVEVRASSDLWVTRCDPHQLENALLNLVINARDAMAENGVLSITTANCALDAAAAAQGEAAAGDYVCLTVGDTGVGMAPETVSRVFEPFFTTKPIGHGTGLGLSMVYGFARQSGGLVQIASRLGAGTEVRLCLPRLHGEAAAEQPMPAAACSARPGAMPPKTILLVDDEPQVRELISTLLRDLGHHCIEAHDGPGGLRVLGAPTPVIDLLITDVGLPGLDGRALAAQARALRPQLKVLFITGYASDAVFDLEAMPGSALLNKPFNLAELAARVDKLMHSH